MSKPPSADSAVLYFAVQTRFHRDSAGRIRTDHGYARFEAWKAYLGGMDHVVLIARVSSEIKESGSLVEGPGVRVMVVPFYRGPQDFLLKYRQLSRFLRLNLTDKNATYGARVPDVLGAIVQGQAKRIGARFFIQVVGDAEDMLRGGALGTSGRRVAGLARRVIARAVRNADGVIYVTRFTLQDKYPAGAGKPTLIRSNVELDLSSFSDAPRDYQLVPMRKPIRLITAGSQEQTYKGHDVLISAVAELKHRGVDVRACIIGGGRHHQDLRDLAAVAGVADRIEFVGHLAGATLVRERIRQSDIFVLPSRTEGLSRALIEAMATGVACLGSAVGGTPELLPDPCLFPPDAPTKLADKVEAFMSDPVLVNEMAKQSWENANEIAGAYSGTAIMTDFLLRFRDLTASDVT